MATFMTYQRLRDNSLKQVSWWVAWLTLCAEQKPDRILVVYGTDETFTASPAFHSLLDSKYQASCAITSGSWADPRGPDPKLAPHGLHRTAHTWSLSTQVTLLLGQDTKQVHRWSLQSLHPGTTLGHNWTGPLSDRNSYGQVTVTDPNGNEVYSSTEASFPQDMLMTLPFQPLEAETLGFRGLNHTPLPS